MGKLIVNTHVQQWLLYLHCVLAVGSDRERSASKLGLSYFLRSHPLRQGIFAENFYMPMKKLQQD